MKSLWNDADAGSYRGELGPRVYTSRLLGGDSSLVLYGGGNTSLKAKPASAEVLFVKGSGSDLARVEAADFVPLDLAATRAVFERADLDNRAMANAVERCVIGTSAIRPSIETMLHAALPFKYVEHTHADSILALANVEDGEAVLAGVYGDLAPSVGYHDSGVELARACLHAFERHGTGRTIGLILRFHGAVAFGDTARASYENMLHLASLAEDFLRARNAWEIPVGKPASPSVDEGALSALRADVAKVAGRDLVMHHLRDPLTLAFAQRNDLHVVSQQGPATPQHAFFTKRVPLIGRDVADYARRYRSYLERHLGKPAAQSMDGAPRIVLDAGLGLCAFGSDAGAAATAAEVYRHDMEIISRASAHGVYRSAPEASVALAEMEYGGFKVTAA
jgi:rhamnose utilization protein RhaD (predicted bifunctional aldolase and dehydrogenase)